VGPGVEDGRLELLLEGLGDGEELLDGGEAVAVTVAVTVEEGVTDSARLGERVGRVTGERVGSTLAVTDREADGLSADPWPPQEVASSTSSSATGASPRFTAPPMPLREPRVRAPELMSLAPAWRGSLVQATSRQRRRDVCCLLLFGTPFSPWASVVTRA
jgi:hypothetical protein